MTHALGYQRALAHRAASATSDGSSGGVSNPVTAARGTHLASLTSSSCAVTSPSGGAQHIHEVEVVVRADL